MTFVYTVRRSGRKVSVTTAGEIDVTSAWPFGAELCRLAEAEPTDLIEVDLAGLVFLDSTGVAALKRAYRTTARHGCRLAVVNPTGVVLRVLDLTGALSSLAPGWGYLAGRRVDAAPGRPGTAPAHRQG